MKSCARAARAAASICSPGRLGPAVGDVVADGGVEQQHVLRHDADLAAQAVERHGGDVDAVDRDPARRGFVQAHQQMGERALAGAVGADDGDGFPGGDGEIDVLQRRRPAGVAEAHVLERDRALDRRQRRADVRRRLGRLVQRVRSRVIAPRAVCVWPYTSASPDTGRVSSCA